MEFYWHNIACVSMGGNDHWISGYLDANGYKRGVTSSSLTRYNVDETMDRHDKNLAQLQLLLLEMERQLLIISAIIDRLRSTWGLPGGLPVIRQRIHRRYRFRPWPTRAELEEEGQYSRPMPMHHLDDPMAYSNLIQMPPELCQELEQRITAEFQRDRTLMRDLVSPGVKLAVTLRHLTTGDSYTTLQYAFRVASATIEKFVPEVCDAIARAYRDQVMHCPTLPEDWLLVESVFRQRWNFSHALGARVGRHIPIRCPQGGGSLFRNCKGFHSIVLLALVDGDSRFLWVDMGAAGSTSDDQVLKHTNLRHKIEDDSVSFPDSESHGIGGPKVNVFILGDDTFPLKLWLMRPYSSTIYGLKGDGLQL